MVVPVVGVVQEVDVARTDAVAEELADRADRPRDRAHVDRHVLRLGDQAPLGVADRGGEVATAVEDLGVGGPQHRLAHLLDDGLEAVLDHGDGDGIDGRLRPTLRVAGRPAVTPARRLSTVLSPGTLRHGGHGNTRMLGFAHGASLARPRGGRAHRPSVRTPLMLLEGSGRPKSTRRRDRPPSAARPARARVHRVVDRGGAARARTHRQGALAGHAASLLLGYDRCSRRPVEVDR